MNKILPFIVAFAASLVVTLILTPLVREMNRRLGMVDKPDPRRINKVPIPRGGGIAICAGVYLGVLVTLSCCSSLHIALVEAPYFWPLSIGALAMACLGLADDRFSLPPRLKLLGQIVIASAAILFGHIGFAHVFESAFGGHPPMWIDFLVTLFWILGAVNAFNLIDGLDGLASGLALIASIGMGGSLLISGGDPSHAIFYCFFAGALLGFLRYNYNPASVFMGDSGSMFIGFILAVIPLVTLQSTPSFVVSIGVPMLAMGVPIFDTSLAIIRRSIRRLLVSKADGKGQVMTADSDHLHHRLLRSFNLSQKKTAWTMYLMALFFVLVAFIATWLHDVSAKNGDKGLSGGLWLLTVTIVGIIIFKDMYRVEFFDAGRVLNNVAHEGSYLKRRRWSQFAVPVYLCWDLLVLLTLSFAFCWIFDIPIWMNGHVFNRNLLTVVFPIRILCIFIALWLARTYRTTWSRAMLSNYLRFFFAVMIGTAIGSSILYYVDFYIFKGYLIGVPGQEMLLSDFLHEKLLSYTVSYALTAFVALMFIRVLRLVVRDLLYAIDCSQLKGRKDVSRILVYGAGLRYRTFRRELVRRATNNTRIIMGILDDDVLLKGKYIGGLRILGALVEAPTLINEYNIDEVVVACQVKPEWLKVIRETLKPTGVKVTLFDFTETEL